jgi:hypothetical protein
MKVVVADGVVVYVDSVYNSHKYFYDDAHLKRNGADIFSLNILQKLKKYL